MIVSELRRFHYLFARQSGVALPVTLDLSDITFAALLLATAALMALAPVLHAYRQPR